MKNVIPKNYIKIFGVFLAVDLPTVFGGSFYAFYYQDFVDIAKKRPPKNLGIETELPLQSTVRLLDFLRTFNRTHLG